MFVADPVGVPSAPDVGLDFKLTVEEGNGAEFSQFNTSKATVPRIVIKCATL